MRSRSFTAGKVSLVLSFFVPAPAYAWWGYGHETITQGVLQSLNGTGDLQRFIGETNDQFAKIPHIEPASAHYINIDNTSTTVGNAGVVSYATDFANFRAGTFTFPTSTATANARYGSVYISSYGGVPWTADATLSSLSTKMQTATSYDDWYRLLATAGALAHYIEDMHQPMHLTKDYDGIPPSGLHANYEGGQFENGSVWRYPELRASMTPVSPTYYGTAASGGFVKALFNRIPTDYDKNVAIRNANSVARAAGTGTVYYDSMWNQTNGITKDSFQHGAGVIASALYTAYVNAGSPTIPQATFFAAPAKEQSTIRSTGAVTDYTNQDFFQVRGDSGPSYGVARFDMATIKAQYDARYGAGQWAIDNVAFAAECNALSSGSLKVFYSADDTTNIQTGSALRNGDGGAPLGMNFSADTPLLQYAIASKPNYTTSRFDSTSSEAFGWTPLQGDILGGGIVTLAVAPGTSTSEAVYYGGAGLSLEVSAYSTAQHWGLDASGNWNSAGNWVGAAPNGVDSVAHFLSAISGSRTVSTDSPVVVGSLYFDNANQYVLAGAGSLTMQVSSGSAVIKALKGSHQINLNLAVASNTALLTMAGSALTVSKPTSLAGGVTLTKYGNGTLTFMSAINANSGASSVTINAGTANLNGSSGGNLTINANSTTNFGASQTLTALNVGNGATATLTPGHNKHITTNTLSITGGGIIDLKDNSMVVASSPVGTWNGTAYNGISGLVASGRNGGAWSGTGIVTSAAIGNLTTLGVANASLAMGINSTGSAVWNGQTVKGTDTLVMYTYAGDANLDGKINVDDYTRIDFNVALGTRGWYNGDFNYDGKINVDDYTIIDFNVGIQGAPLSSGLGMGSLTSAPVPEPGGLCALFVSALLARRRKQ